MARRREEEKQISFGNDRKKGKNKGKDSWGKRKESARWI
jgi:hypothetical protein